MDLSKLKMTDWLVGGGTVVYLIAMFLPWYEADFGIVSASESGWGYFLPGIVPLLLLIAVTVFLVVPKLRDGMNLPEKIGPLPRNQAALIAAGVATLLVLFRLIVKDDGGVEEAEEFIDRGIGLYIAFIAAAVVTVGTVLKYLGKEDGPSSSPSAPPTPF